MAALTNDRKVAEKATGYSRVSSGPTATVPPQIWAGSLLMLGKDDNTLKPVTSSAGAVRVQVVGVANDRVTAGVAYFPAAGGQLEFKRGVFAFNVGTGTNAVSSSMVGQLLYASDDNTVNATSNGGTWPLAGRLDSYDSVLGAFVLIDADAVPSGSLV